MCSWPFAAVRSSLTCQSLTAGCRRSRVLPCPLPRHTTQDAARGQAWGSTTAVAARSGRCCHGAHAAGAAAAEEAEAARHLLASSARRRGCEGRNSPLRATGGGPCVIFCRRGGALLLGSRQARSTQQQLAGCAGCCYCVLAGCWGHCFLLGLRRPPTTYCCSSATKQLLQGWWPNQSTYNKQEERLTTTAFV